MADSIAGIGSETFQRYMEAFHETSRIGTEGYEATRGSLERQGQNTFNREIRRSPADGTFRTREQFESEWDAFNSRAQRTMEVVREEFRQVPFNETYPDAEFIEETRKFKPTPTKSFSIGAHEISEHVIDNVKTTVGNLRFEINGTPGVVGYEYDPKTKDIHINWMGGETSEEGGRLKFHNIAPMEMGSDKVLKIMKEIVDKHPDAKTITAERVSGARGQRGNKNFTGPIKREIPGRQDVTAGPPAQSRMPGLPMPGGGAPGQRLTDLY